MVTSILSYFGSALPDEGTADAKVENPLGVSRGVATVELDGALQTSDDFPLSDDSQTHIVRVVMGEKPRSDSVAEEAKTAHEQPTSSN